MPASALRGHELNFKTFAAMLRTTQEICRQGKALDLNSSGSRGLWSVSAALRTIVSLLQVFSEEVEKGQEGKRTNSFSQRGQQLSFAMAIFPLTTQCDRHRQSINKLL